MKYNLAKILIVIFMLLFILPLCTVHAKSDKTDELLKSMTLEEKIAQMLMPEFTYYTDEDETKKALTEVTSEVENILQKYGFAGIILMGANNSSTEQTVKLIDELQMANATKANRPQLFIAIDQEGGVVTRLSNGTRMPGNMALVATGDSQNAYTAGKIIGAELSKIGYNVDFAPVVDVNNNPANPVIGVRSFSDDVNTVSEFGVQFMKGIQSEKIISSLKHFPGHGDTSTDSHSGLPRIEKTYDELKNNELLPFKACIDEGANIIMTAHIQYPQIEKETYTSIKDGQEIELPATLSKTIITDILRGDLGYDGVVVTDAMNMSAISEHFKKLDAAKLAINAGVDMILMPIDTSTNSGITALEQYINDLATMVENGDISEENVNNAVTRILSLKEEQGIIDKYDGGNLQNRIEEATKYVGSKENHDIEWEIAEKSITLVKNDNDMLPIANNEKTVVMVAYANEVLSAEYAVDMLKSNGKIPQNMDISVYLYKDKSIEEMQETVSEAKNVIVISEVYNENGLSGDIYTKMDELISFVHSNGNKIAFISCALPYDVARLQGADAIIVAWNYNGMNEKPDFSQGLVKTYGVSIPAGIYMMFGNDTKVRGILPVNIPILDSEYKYTDSYLYKKGYGLKYSSDTEEVTEITNTAKVQTNDVTASNVNNLPIGVIVSAAIPIVVAVILVILIYLYINPPKKK